MATPRPLYAHSHSNRTGLDLSRLIISLTLRPHCEHENAATETNPKPQNSPIHFAYTEGTTILKLCEEKYNVYYRNVFHFASSIKFYNCRHN